MTSAEQWLAQKGEMPGAPPSRPPGEPARRPEEGGARQEPKHDGEGPLLDLFVAENTGQQKEVHAQ